jgi:birA, biotin-[acetyl-CoA-carboxylase] ligase region
MLWENPFLFLTTSWGYNNAMDLSALKYALSDIQLGGLRAFDTIGSTNDEAIAWADAGCADFSLVIADEQTRGRGRFDRRWVTRPGASLAFSLILTPSPAELPLLPLFAPLCGLAIWQALKDRYGIPTEIKWPNDILLHRRKCSGILVEAAWNGSRLQAVVLGIGINIREDSIPPADLQMFPASFLNSASDLPIDRFELLAAVLHTIHAWRPKMGSPEFYQTWQVHLAFKGEQVAIVQSPKPSIIGVIEGIDGAGRLVLRESDDKLQYIEVGDVHLRQAGEQTEKEKDHAG